MAKKIRQVKLVEEDISKNSGKEISHTIAKIKAHERLYTFLLVLVFMVTISVSIFLGFKVDSYQLYDASSYFSSFSYSGQSIILTSKDVMSDENGLDSVPYTLHYTNNTEKNINFLLRFALDEEALEKCNCKDKIVDYKKLKYSIDGEKIEQFNGETMIFTAGMIAPQEDDTFSVHLWIDESVQDDCLYYGKFILEEIEDMDQ